MNSPRLLPALVAITLCAMLAGCQREKEPAAAISVESSASQGTIVAVGDSLTAGSGVSETEAYPAQLERKLRQAGYDWRVVNAGIGGETSSGALSRIDWILKLDPDIVILETGANDGLRGVDPDLTRRNLDQIVTALQSKGVVVVLAGMQMLRNMGTDYTAKFAAIYPTIAKKHDLILIPFFLSKVAGEADLNLSDGIHPTTKGYGVVADTVYPYLLQAIETKKKR